MPLRHPPHKKILLLRPARRNKSYLFIWGRKKRETRNSSFPLFHLLLLSELLLVTLSRLGGERHSSVVVTDERGATGNRAFPQTARWMGSHLPQGPVGTSTSTQEFYISISRRSLLCSSEMRSITRSQRSSSNESRQKRGDGGGDGGGAVLSSRPAERRITKEGEEAAAAAVRQRENGRERTRLKAPSIHSSTGPVRPSIHPSTAAFTRRTRTNFDTNGRDPTPARGV